MIPDLRDRIAAVLEAEINGYWHVEPLRLADAVIRELGLVDDPPPAGRFAAVRVALTAVAAGGALVCVFLLLGSAASQWLADVVALCLARS
jgi:hypothetical protein